MSSDNKSSGIGIVGLLGVVFVTLKLCHVINWSWWWVTLPFWGGIAAVAAFLGFMLVLVVIADFLK